MKFKVKKSFISAAILILAALNVGCGAGEDNANSTSSIEDIQINIVADTLNTVVNDEAFKKLKDYEQVERISSELDSMTNKEGADGYILYGSIRYSSDTRTFNFKYINGEMGEFSLNGIDYAINNEENLVWQGTEPIIDTSKHSEESTEASGNGSEDIGHKDINDIEAHYRNTAESSNTGILPTKNTIVAVRLVYNTSKKSITGNFVTSNLAVYDFDFSKSDLYAINIKDRLEDIMCSTTYLKVMKKESVEDLYMLGNRIDVNAKLDTEHYNDGTTTEVIYAFDQDSETLIECVSRGDYNNTLQDSYAQDFVLKLYDALENDVTDK
jgi:hypothetical protein